jgi:hypothetical protein
MAKFPISKDYRHNSQLKAVIPRNQAVPIMSVILTLSHKTLIYASKPLLKHPSKPSLSTHLATAKRMATVSRHHTLHPLTLLATAKRMATVSHHHVRFTPSHPFYISPLHTPGYVSKPFGGGAQ